MAGEFEIQGLGNVLQRMRQLAPKLQLKGARIAARRGANVIKKAAQQNAKRVNDPETANDISKNIAVQYASKTSKQIGGVVMRIGVRGGARNPGLSRSVKSKVRGSKANAGGDTWYWRFVELGTSRMRAQPSMVPAMADNVDRATNEVVTSLNREIDKLIAGELK